MAKKYGPVTVVAYARTRDGDLIDVESVDGTQRRELATELKLRLLNGFYAGKGVAFYRADDREKATGAAETGA